MRRVSLFVHSPVNSSLDSGIVALEHGEHYAIHEIKVDDEMFPLLVEAKPCLLMVSIDNADKSANVFNLMKSFKEYRVTHKGAARDPGLRIVVVSEGKIPRLNWSSLGVYEVIVGPVQPNVLTYKLNRHYQKVLTAGEVEPDVQMDLMKEVPLKPEAQTPEWKIFKSPPPEKIVETRIKGEREVIQHLSLRVRIPDIDPERGEWRKSDVQTDPPPQWNWEFVEEDPEHGKLAWAFRGEEPTFVQEDGSWQFNSEAPKLLKLNPKTQASVVEFEFEPKVQGSSEDGHLNVRPELDLRSVNSRTYSRPNQNFGVRVQNDPHENVAGPEKDAEKNRERAKEQFGSRPTGSREEADPNFGNRPNEHLDAAAKPADSVPVPKAHAKPDYGSMPGFIGGQVAGNFDKAPKEKEVAQANYGDAPDAREHESVSRNPNRKHYEDSAVPAKAPALAENFEFEQGIIRPKPPKLFSKSPATTAPAKVQANGDSGQNQWGKRPGEISPHESAEELKRKQIQNSQSFGEARDLPSLENPRFGSGPLQVTRDDLRANFQVEPKHDSELKTNSPRPEPMPEPKKQWGNALPDSRGAKVIQSDEQNGSLSILYEDESKVKTRSRDANAKKEKTFDVDQWNFRMVKRSKAEDADAKDPKKKSLIRRKIPLSPQIKLTDDEKFTLIERIIKFMVDLFKRK